MAATHWNVVEQGLGIIKKMEQYINEGQDCTGEIALDIIELQSDQGDREPKLNELRDTMLEYCKMDHDLKQFLQAVDFVKDQVRSGEAGENLEEILDGKLAEMTQAEGAVNHMLHAKFADMEERINAATSAEEPATPSAPTQIDEDIAMTQTALNTKCPYTQQEMKDPVKNRHCGHSYDREGIVQLIKHRRGKAKCPVSGCPNVNFIQESDLEPDHVLKAYILRKQKGGAKHSRKNASGKN